MRFLGATMVLSLSSSIGISTRLATECGESTGAIKPDLNSPGFCRGTAGGFANHCCRSSGKD